MSLAEELQRDPDYSNSFLERPEMLGVDSPGESAVKLRILIKTRPLHQWRIKREMLRRIMRRFSELGIEISLPQRIVRNRQESVPANRVTELHQRAA